MNKGAWFIVGNIFGTVLGIGVGAFLAKKKYDDTLEQRLFEMEEYFNASYEYKKGDYSEPESKTDDPCDRENGVLTDEQRRSIREKLKKNIDGTNDSRTNEKVQYNKAWNNKKISDEHSSEEDSPVVNFDEYAEHQTEINLDASVAEYNNTKSRPPKLISYDDIDGLSSIWDIQTLFYYPERDTITDENDEEIIDSCNIVGNCLDKYDFRNSDERTIYIQNFELNTVYEITKIN